MYIRQITFTLLFLWGLEGNVISQVSYSANDSVSNYNGLFRPGYNPSFAAGWSDLDFANLSAGNPSLYMKGTGLKSVRDGLFFEALRVQGFDSKIPEMEHYRTVGLSDLTMLLVGGENGYETHPTQPYRDQNEYCAGVQSELFANLYAPIWDGGENGTAYNDTNYFAVYLYNTVLNYREYVQFWEVWNEPGFDFSGNQGWREPGDPMGNWWDADPNPCDYKLHAPVTHYVRMLRIAWEIVKTLDPDAYVCMGAPGFPSFVDAVARNTDNPVDGSASTEFPLKGGAYFDAVCYHSFPHFDGSMQVSSNPVTYLRNSDVAADGIVVLKNKFENVLEKYGYNGTIYPRKKFLITEINLPAKIFTYKPYTYGGQIGQRNFMMKSLVNCKIADIKQMHVYTLSELRKESEAGWEFDLMGLYTNLDSVPFNAAFPNDAGIGIHTLSDLIFETTHDPIKSAAIKNPNVRAEAFRRSDGSYVYVLWARMMQDFSEIGTYDYAFPDSVGISPFLRKYVFTHSITEQSFITKNEEIVLDGTPIVLVEEPDMAQPLPGFTASARSGCVPFEVGYTDESLNADSLSWEFIGGVPMVTPVKNPTVLYEIPGLYTVTLTAFDSLSSNTNFQNYYLYARTVPVASFQTYPTNSNVFFLNTSAGGDSYLWEFGDGTTSTEVFPNHDYLSGGKYMVRLTVVNPCGNATVEQEVTVLSPLAVNFNVDQNTGCTPFAVQFQSNTPTATNYYWQFPGGTPATSDEANPSVVYSDTGKYWVKLTCWNDVVSGQLERADFISVNKAPSALFEVQTNGLSISVENLSAGALSYLWSFGDGTTTQVDSIPSHTYAASGTYTLTLVASNECGASVFSKTVTVLAPPVAQFLSTPLSGCVPLTVQFVNQSGENSSVLWTFEGGTPAVSTEQAPTVQYAQTGHFSVRMRVANSSGTDSLTKDSLVYVAGAPLAGFNYSISGDTVFFQNESAFENTVLWDFGDNTTSFETNPIHIFDVPGQYLVLLTASNDCGSDVAQQPLRFLTSHTFLEDDDALTVLPNPNQGDFFIKISLGNGVTETLIKLIEPTGKVLFEQRANLLDGKLTVPIHLEKVANSGVFVVQVTADNFIKTVPVAVFQKK